ncbi:Cof-type HAD-IIB family hydrolase [Spiroplasma sp. BIUS-1]|uniref:Cof-type HAD-IIB family hydrolase n=1 Tax=Spiroplasma sp. BIUS-1 TaxID=216964 RepID=UPI001398A5D8|nr:Cof-type HAD-IIB family hydrolase [Spiroplasma sp. BIUS-1]QHX36403.1 HAD superfamily hydrolase [Spiroplasma sp. BIUS-1]
MSYKILALDMDGTTFKSLDDIVMENVEPINKAIKKGTKVVFVTGRPIHTKLNRLELFDFSSDGAIFAAFNGALIYDLKDKKAIDANPIDKETALKAFELLKSDKDFSEVELWAYTVDDTLSYVSMPIEKAKVLKHETNFFDYEPVIFEQGMEMLDCHKILTMNTNTKFVNKLKELGLEVSWTEGSPAGEVTKKGINKKYALEFLSKKFSIDKEEILAMGDGANDVPMFEYAGLSIAPANAHDEIKEKATEVSEYTNLEGAVAKAINKYILGE